MKATKLSRSTSHRRLLVKNLATSVLLYERAQTTPAKARAAQSHAERLVTTAKRWVATESAGERLALYRKLLAETTDELAAKKLIEVLAVRFANRAGGYTRRVRLSRRLGDGAEQVLIRLTQDKTEDQSAATPMKRESKKDTNGAQ